MKIKKIFSKNIFKINNNNILFVNFKHKIKYHIINITK